MRSKVREGEWDFTPVIELIYSLSSGHEDAARKWTSPPETPERPSTPIASTGLEDIKSQLGNFDKLWKFLGQPLNDPPPSVSSGDRFALKLVLQNTDPPEQTFLHSSSPPKVVKWRDEVEGAELEDNDGLNHDLSVARLKQKKQERKKELKRKQQEVSLQTSGRSVLLQSASGAEPENKLPNPRHSPDRRAIIQQIVRGTGESPSPPASRSPPKGCIISGGHGGWPISQSFTTQAPQDVFLSPEHASLALAAAKKSKLIAKLNARFLNERQFITNVSFTQKLDRVSPDGALKGVHVFVDASNIMIGVHDALKVARGLSITSRIRRQPISFHNLSLILERGRPAAKRVVVGSDNFPAITEAKLIGYETNILERVHKAKELTPRQKKFRRGSGTSGQSSGSETNATHTPEKWVEQAVDEILHLKMLESIVDAKEAATIVLATGDAAEAEYSQGFLKMVERALEKGWKVELASFKHNTSGAYKRKEFRTRWAQQFMMIELDAFVEELLST
ncbi:PIN domain-like [Lasallia pustulata]|uniref:PIN domain-like n=1 Tax=Lasallia pustulata TaxID=136370 RepID=A0A1W5D2G6_9LECA|nr:PIN domain-like [Lasallia pustulata]